MQVDSTFQRAPHNKEHPYLMVTKTMLRDPDLSFGAKGLLSYLLSFTDDWKIRHCHIIRNMNIGETALNSLINELLKKGYASRSRERLQNGRWGAYHYHISELKIFLPDGEIKSGENEKDAPDKTPSQNSLSQTGFPSPENQALLKNVTEKETNEDGVSFSDEIGKENSQADITEDSFDPQSISSQELIEQTQNPFHKLDFLPSDVVKWIKKFGCQHIQKTIRANKSNLIKADNQAAYMETLLKKQ